jgi:NADH-quinone oxidoreductase subunit G
VLRAFADAMTCRLRLHRPRGPARAAERASARAGRGAAQAAGGAGRSLERIAATADLRADAVLRRAAALNAHPLTAARAPCCIPPTPPRRNLERG